MIPFYIKALIVAALALSARIILIMRKSKKEKTNQEINLRRKKEVYSLGERDTSLDAFVIRTKASDEQVQKAR